VEGVQRAPAGSLIKCLGLVRRLFAFATNKGWLDADPVAGVKPSHLGARMSDPRERVLSDDEIRQMWKLPPPYGPILKAITTTVRSINTKYGRESLEWNACRFLFFSNHPDAIPLDEKDRRYEVAISNAKPRSREYYAKLFTAIKDPVFINSIGVYLERRSLKHFSAGEHAKMTPDKAQVIEASRSPFVSVIFDFLKNCDKPLVTSGEIRSLLSYSDAGEMKANASYINRCILDALAAA
jgi:hypothetical protein